MQMLQRRRKGDCTLKILLKTQGNINRGESINKSINKNTNGPLILHCIILLTQILWSFYNLEFLSPFILVLDSHNHTPLLSPVPK